MKPFLGIDITVNKKNEKINGDEFLVAVPSEAMKQSYEHSSEKAQETIEQAKLPLPLRIGQWICGAVGFLIAIGIIRGLDGNDDIPLSQAYENAPWLFWLAGITLLIWSVLKLISRKKEKTVFETDESEQVVANLQGACNAIQSELSVPQDAKEIDILSFFYKVKNDSIKPCEKGMQITAYINPVFNIFTDSENLYFSNLEGKYAFPLSSLVSISTVKKHIRIMMWNKDEAFNKGKYKQYKLTRDNYGCIHCNCYYILNIKHNNELWGIYFPCYELPIFEELTGLKAE